MYAMKRTGGRRIQVEVESLTCVVGTNNQDEIGVLHIAVDFLHFLDNIIWDSSFGQENLRKIRRLNSVRGDFSKTTVTTTKSYLR
jgi:hypothetical protein